MPEFNPHKAVEEAHERSEHGHGPRWIPIAAAVLAVLAAFTNLVSNQRSTAALIAKNEAILETTKASDQYNYYQAHRLRETVYQAALDAGTAGSASAKLKSVAAHERSKEPRILAEARSDEERAKAAQELSERNLRSHETLEVAVTLFEVAIVLVSISALASSLLLTTLAAAGTAGGVAFLLMGLLRG